MDTQGGMFDLSHGAHISGSTIAVVVRWVRGQLGDEGVARLLAKSGERRPLALLEEGNEWSSYQQATALLDAAVRVTGHLDAARRIGEEMLAQHRGTAVVDLLRSLGSPEALLSSIAESGAKFSTVFTMTPQQVSPGHAVVLGSTPAGVPRHRLLCEFTTGILSIIPTVFDLSPAVVTESQCQARGDTHCLYVLSWDPNVSAEQSDTDGRVQRLESRLQEVQGRLNAMQSTAAEMVSATDVDSALKTITRRAGDSVRATHYLLAVQMPSEDRLRVHSSGMTTEEADALAPTLIATGSTSSRLVAEVASTTRRYGVLAAMFTDEASSFFPQELDILSSYAGYAATILDTAWAIEEARRQSETARALLDLSRALAEVAAPEEVAQRLATAVPRVVDCDQGSVLLWHEDEQLLRLAGCVNIPPELEQLLRAEGLGLGDATALRGMLANPEPLFMSSDEGDPFNQELLRRSGSSAAVVVPILGSGVFHGVVTAAVRGKRSRLDPSSGLLERLESLANQAATALTNARLVAELQHQALRDALTGLPNRTLLVERIDQALSRSRRGSSDCAVLFLDLDRFKQVNDSLGHIIGDQLLVEVAQRLCKIVREGDTVARLGGDEFAVLLRAVSSSDETLEVAGRILAEISRPFCLEAAEFFVTVSIGISLGRHRNGNTSSQVLREADAAMYTSKAAGGGGAHLSPSSPQPVGQSRLHLKADLHVAIARRQLRVVYQPLVDLTTGVVIGTEALVRWGHPRLGAIPPVEFLPLAEDTELGVDIDLWVLDHACRQLRRWLTTATHDMRVAVNLSRRTVTSERLQAAVTRHLADGRLRGRLELEVTERLLDTDPEHLAGYLQPLRAAGATIAIDDFGTGSSGFARLQGVHVQTLKIDRSFLAEITAVDAPAPVLAAMISMGVALHLDVIAEGIERDVEREWLIAAGCRIGQGFLLGRPADATHVGRYLRGGMPHPRQPVQTSPPAALSATAAVR